MNIQFNKVILWCYFFCNSLSILASSMIKFDYPKFGSILSLFSNALFLLLFFLSFHKKVKPSFFVFVFIYMSLLIFLISYSANSPIYLVRILIICFIFVDMDYLDIIKVSFYSVFFSTSILISGSLIGIFTNLISPRIVNNEVVGYRQALGFTHPNILAFNLMVLFVLYNFSSKRKNLFNDKFGMMLYLILLYLIMFIANSRTYLIILLVFIIIMLFYNYLNPRKLKWINYILLFLFNVFTIFSMIGIKYSLLETIDETLKSRLLSNSLFFKMYGVQFFGNYDITRGNFFLRDSINQASSLILDNSYARLLIINGLLFYFLIMMLFILNINSSYKKSNKYALIFIIITLISMFSEGQFIVNHYLSLGLTTLFSTFNDRFKVPD